MRHLVPLGLLAVVLAAAGASSGQAGSAGNCAQSDDPSEGWEAVFGHFTSRHAADKVVSQAIRKGFKVIRVEQDGCKDWEVEVPGGNGLATSKQRHGFWREARSARFAVTFEAPCCLPGNDSGPDWEAVFGHEPSLEAATTLMKRAMRAGFKVMQVELDRPGDYEVEVPGGTGLQTEKQRKDFTAEARSVGFRVSFEKS